MKPHYKSSNIRLLIASAAVALLPLLATAFPFKQSAYDVTNLISNLPGVAANQDPNLVNPWGFIFDPNGNLFIADNGTSLATFYLADGTVLPFSINVPSDPSGEVYNTDTNEFIISEGTNSGPAALLFATEDGQILGFNISVAFFNSILEVDNSSSGAVYKGIALARVFGQQLLYATDFHNNQIDVFDDTFAPLGSFTDKYIPAGFAPFNIQNLGGWLYVTFAKQDSAGHDDVAGLGNGFVDIFAPDGRLLRRLVSHDHLNSPWGLTIAPRNFGAFGGALLVGNFGDGTINAYDPFFGSSLGQLSGSNGQPLKIDGLWGLNFNPTTVGDGDGDADDTNTPSLYFTSGPDGETNGLVGAITPETGKHPHFPHGHCDFRWYY